MRQTIPFDKPTAKLVREWLDWLRTPTVPAIGIAVDGRTDRPAWLAARRKGIGASDIAAVLGMSAWTSPFALWWEKHLGWDLPATDAMQDGLRVEEWAHGEFERRHPELYIARPGHGLYQDAVEPWMLCTPDFLAVDYLPKPLTDLHWSRNESDAYVERQKVVYPRPKFDPANVVVRPVEVKSDGHGDWGRPGTDEVPDQYALQVKWQCHILGCNGGWLVRRKTVGDHRYSEYYVPYERGELDYAMGEARRFMTSLELGTPPDPDASTSTLEALRQMHPAPAEEEIATIDFDLAVTWRNAREAKARIAEQVKLLDNLMREAMAGAGQAMTPNGDVIAERRLGKRAGYEVGPCETDQLRVVKSERQSSDRSRRHGPTADPEAATPGTEELERRGDGEADELLAAASGMGAPEEDGEGAAGGEG